MLPAVSPENARATFRVTAEFVLRCMSTLMNLIDGDPFSTLVFNAMWAANVREVTASEDNRDFGGLDDIPPDSLRKPVAVLTLSKALGVPNESVRRCVFRLEKQGLCVRLGREGWIVPARVFEQNAFLAGFPHFWHSLRTFVADLRRSGYDFSNIPACDRAAGDPARYTEAIPDNIRALLRASMEFVLRAAGTVSRLHHGKLLEGLIFARIWTLNVRRVTFGPQNLAFDGISDLPPDSVRDPVTVQRIADTLGLPYETTRRAVNKLVSSGLLVRAGRKGVLAPREALAAATNLRAIAEMQQHLEQFVLDLRRAGLDFDRC